MASHARNYLVVFDEHTQEPLYLGRSKRLASVGQRLGLHARDRGRTKPGCTVLGYSTQVHHTKGWKNNATPTSTKKSSPARGTTGSLKKGGPSPSATAPPNVPPPPADTGQTRINYRHHPERLLAEPGDDP